MVLRDRVSVALEIKDLERVEQLIKQSIEFLKNSNQKGHLGITQVQLAKVLATKGDFNKAEVLIKESIRLIEQSQDRFFEASAYFNLARSKKREEK